MQLRVRPDVPVRAFVLAGLLAAPAAPQELDDEPLLLRSSDVRLPAELERFVRDPRAALVLGKALFWDEQVGSDGRVACATCHFAAGADHRTRATVHPGPDGVLDTVLTDGRLTPDVFPLTSDDVVGSRGVARRLYRGAVPGAAGERGAPDPDEPDDGRRVTPRNSPSVLNAALGGLFWDGRAPHTFDGAASGGEVLLQLEEGLERVSVAVGGAALASQAVLPPLDEVEMSYVGRGFQDLGQKLVGLAPLARQEVHPEDSVLGPFRRANGRGLKGTYEAWIRRAFRRPLWDSDVLLDAAGEVVGSGPPLAAGEYTLLETNFDLVFGLALLVYESTLVSDDTLWDRVQRGEAELTPVQAHGLALFEGKGCCAPCHAPPEFTAAVHRRGDDPNGFANTGLRPIEEDPGRARGEFKVPSLRNVELTGPYFHTGGMLTLLQVVDFYDRGGDYASPHTDLQVQPIGLGEDEKLALVHFLLTLTDERVRRRAAPFDGPSLAPPGGEPLPATGREGGEPLGTFLGVSPLARE